MDTLTELLVITMEEAGELIQACSKVLRTKDQPNNLNYKDDLSDEAGDMLAMINLMIDHGLISQSDLVARVETKRKKLEKWSSLIIKGGTEVEKAHQ